MRSRVVQSILRMLSNMALVAIAVTIAKKAHREIYVIPRGLVELSLVAMDKQEIIYFFTLSLLVVYGVTTLGVILSRRLKLNHPEALAQDSYAIILASTLATSIYFVATEKNFSPNFFVQFMLLCFVLRLMWVFTVGSITSSVSAVITNTLRGLRKPFGILTVLVVLLPGLLLVGYKKDRRIANLIHRTRRAISQGSMPYDVKPLHKDLRFEQPIEVEFDKEGNMYVLERVGKLYLIVLNDELAGEKATGEGYQKHLLLNFSEQVGKVAVENGALGFALHPEFADPESPNSNRFFAAYTHWEDDALKNRLSEFLVSEAVLNRALAFGAGSSTNAQADSSDTEQALLGGKESILIEQTRKNDGYHNAGAVEFGPKGFLYIAVGEATERKNHQQIDHALYSGILRIDIDNREDSLPIRNQPRGGKTQGYKIPKDNPFVEIPNALHEFYAIGFRNPFRISFDSRTGRLWAGEVGNITYEEVDIVEPGGNYQFPYGEGPVVGKKPKDSIGEEKKPYFYYTHTALNRAIIGGEVYRGSKFKELQGQYIFGDNYSGRIMSIKAKGQTWKDGANTIAVLPHLGQMGLTSLRQSPSGEFYLTSLGKAGSGTGRVWQLTTEEQDHEDKKELTGVSDPIPPHKMFEQYCSRCHGVNGRGKEEVSKALKVEMANFQSKDWQEKSTQDYITNVILNGGTKMGLNAGMPSWSNILSKEQAKLIARYIKNGLPAKAEAVKTQTR